MKQKENQKSIAAPERMLLNAVFCSKLEDREITVIRECFGIGCQKEALDEIAEDLGLTREGVKQICEDALMKICDTENTKRLMEEL